MSRLWLMLVRGITVLIKHLAEELNRQFRV